MKRVMVRYKVKPGRADENESYIRAVFEQLEETAPAALQYASFRLDDGVSFVHFACIEGEENPLSQSSAFQAFTSEIKDRCEEPPVAVTLNEIGSYNFLGENS